MQGWNRFADARFDVAIAAIAAFCAGVLERVSFHRDHKFRLWLDSPHRIDKVAGILGSQLQAKLAPQFARTETRFISRCAEVFEMHFDSLWGYGVQISAHFRNTHG